MARANRQHAYPLLASLFLAATLGAAGGCAFESGKGFGTLRAELRSSFAGLDEDAGRVQPDGWYKTNNSFELLIETLELEYRNTTLRGGTGNASSATDDCSFDPANPPSGCSLCHNGHCHCGEALRDYEELEAELCGGSGTSGPSELAQFQVAGPQNLLGEGTHRTLNDCSAVGDPRLASQTGPVCELDAGSLELVQLLLDGLHVQARLRDRSAADRLGGAELAVTIDWDFSGAPMVAQVDPAEPVDHKSSATLDLAMSLPISAKLLDDIAWETLDREDEAIHIDARRNTAVGEQITSNLALSELGITVSRDDG